MSQHAGLIDFHCHLARCGGRTALGGPVQPTLDGPRNEARVLAVTNRVSEWQGLAKSRRGDRVVWALGLHPGEPHTQRDVARFVDLIPQAAAIGEVGLDYTRRTNVPREAQRRNLDRVLEAAADHPAIISIHSAGAASEVVALLAARRPPGAVLHWFTGGPSEIGQAIDLDVYFSVNHRMLAGDRGKALAFQLPPNRIVLETDAPYGTPSAKTPMEIPRELERVLSRLSALWRLPIDETRQRILQNQVSVLDRTPATTWR